MYIKGPSFCGTATKVRNMTLAPSHRLPPKGRKKEGKKPAGPPELHCAARLCGAILPFDLFRPFRPRQTRKRVSKAAHTGYRNGHGAWPCDAWTTFVPAIGWFQGSVAVVGCGMLAIEARMLQMPGATSSNLSSLEKYPGERGQTHKTCQVKRRWGVGGSIAVGCRFYEHGSYVI